MPTFERTTLVGFIILLFSICDLKAQTPPPFTLNVNITDATCFNNGVLEFVTSGTDPSAILNFTVDSLGSNNFPIITNNTSISALLPGTYSVMATQTMPDGQSNSEIVTGLIIQNFYPGPLKIDLKIKNVVCGNDGSIGVEILNGTLQSLEIVSGPNAPIFANSNNVFENLAVGTYEVVLIDDCQDKMTEFRTITAASKDITFQNIGRNEQDKLPSCDSITVVRRINSPNQGRVIAFPLSVQISVTPPGGINQVYSQILDGSTLNFTQNLPFVPSQNYSYTITILDDCGDMVFQQSYAINRTIDMRNVLADVNCGESVLQIAPLAYLGSYTVSFNSAPPAFDALLLNPNHPGPFTTSTQYGNSSNAIPEGYYSITITDECGRSDIESFTNQNNPNTFFNVKVVKPDCDLFHGAVRLISLGYEYQEAIIIDAPTGYANNIPDTISDCIEFNVIQLANLNPGEYEIELTDVCGQIDTAEFQIGQFQQGSGTAELQLVNCDEYQIIANTDAYSDQLNFEFYDFNLLEWRIIDPIHSSGIDGPYNRTGLLRVTSEFSSFVDCSRPNKSCKTELARFFLPNLDLQIKSLYAFECNNGTYDIAVDAIGFDMTYLITSQNGSPINIDNGNDPVFTNLAPALYNVQVKDDCGNIVNRLIEVTQSNRPIIRPRNLCVGENGSLSIEGLNFMEFNWWKNSNPSDTISNTYILNLLGFDPAFDAGAYTVSVKYLSPNSCIDELISFNIPSNTNQVPYAGLDSTLIICNSNQTIDLNDFIGQGFDTYGTWTDLAGSNGLNGNQWIINNLNDTTYQFQYVVDGLCIGSDTALVQIELTSNGSICNPTDCNCDDAAPIWDFLPDALAPISCGDTLPMQQTLTATDVLGPPPIAVCTSSVIVNLIPTDLDGDGAPDTEQACLTASSLNISSYHPCFGESSLIFAFDSLGINDTLCFDCEDIGLNDVDLYVIDSNGNFDVCITTVEVQDNNDVDVCPDIKDCIEWPMHLTFLDCNADIDPNNIGSIPIIDNNCICNPIGVTFVDFLVSSQSCVSIYRNWKVLFDCGNLQDSCEYIQEITIINFNAPEIACPQDIVVAANIQCEADIILSEPFLSNSSCNTGLTITHNSNFANSSGPNASGTYPVGVHNIVFTVTDNCNNSNSCSTTITVQDKTSPIANCNDITIQLNMMGIYQLTASDINLIGQGSADNCGLVSLQVDPNIFDCSDLGNNVVTLTVTDESGSTDQCQAIVTVIDGTSPNLVCNDINVFLDINGQYNLTAQDSMELIAGSSASCSDIVSIDISQTSFSCNDVGFGSIEVEITATDGNNSSVMCTAVITVLDEISPNVVCQDMQVNCDLFNGDFEQFNLISMIDDNCPFNLIIDTLSSINNLNDCGIGNFVREFLVADASGNTDFCTAVVSIVGPSSPTNIFDFIFPQDTIIVDNCTSIDTMNTGYVTIDNSMLACEYFEISFTDIPSAPHGICSDTIFRSWMMLDTCNNQDFAFEQVIIIIDTIAPVLIVSTDTVFVDNPNQDCELFVGLDTVVSVTDCANGTLIITNNSAFADDPNSTDASGTYPGGTHNIEVIATDACGNVDTISYVLVIEESTYNFICNKVFQPLDDVSLMACVPVTDIAQINGVCDPTFMIKVKDELTGIFYDETDTIKFDCGRLGPNEFFAYLFQGATLIDSCMTNSNTGRTLVTITDPNGVCPTIIGKISNFQNTYLATPELFKNEIIESSSNKNKIDTKSINTNAILPFEQINLISFTAMKSLLINLSSEDLEELNSISKNKEDYLNLSEINSSLASESGFSMAQLNNVTITTKIIEPSVKDTCAGYDIIYRWIASDDCGNMDSIDRILEVLPDTEPPVCITKDSIDVYVNQNGIVDISPNDLDFGSYDQCRNVMLELSSTRFDCTDLGVNQDSLIVIDECGNSSICIAIVTVIDTFMPTCRTNDITVYLDQQGLASITTNDIDNGSTSVCPLNLSLDKDMFNCDDIGNVIVTLTASNSSGSAICTSIVSVVDTIMPTCTIPDQIVFLDQNGLFEIKSDDFLQYANDNCDSIEMKLSRVSDNCDGSTPVLAQKVIFCCQDVGSSIMVFAEVKDLSNNLSQCRFLVEAIDSLAPTCTPGFVTTQLPALECEGEVFFTLPQPKDNCGSNPVIVPIPGQPGSGSIFPIGTISILYNVMDSGGNTRQCSFDVIVEEFPISHIGCKDINVSLDETCQAEITPLMLLTGENYGCLDSCTVTITDKHGDVLPDNIVTGDHAGQELTVMVCCGGNCCWSTIFVENKLPPTISCKDTTITCLDIEDLDQASVITFPGVNIESNCSYTQLKMSGQLVENIACDYEDAILRLTRTWIAVTDGGLESTPCTQTITVNRLEVDSIKFPSLTIVDCEDASYLDIPPSRYILDVPYYNHPTKGRIDLYPAPKSLCNIEAIYEDHVILDNGCKKKLFRTWSLWQWHCGDEKSRKEVQLIEILDTISPIVSLVDTLNVSLNGHHCDANITLPYPKEIWDNCSQEFTIGVSHPNGFVQDLDADIINLQIGIHKVIYYINDGCDNITKDSIIINVKDYQPPVTICDEYTTVGLVSDGWTSVSAISIDNGSYDYCSEVTLKVARMIHPMYGDSLIFGDEVFFYCEDIGDTIQVVLRAYDASGNSNDCMVWVEVQDKLVAQLICPDNVIRECHESYDQLNLSYSFGDYFITDNCPNVNPISDVLEGDLNKCGFGSLYRRVTLYDLDSINIIASCTQYITVKPGKPFSPQAIVWPPAEFEYFGCIESNPPTDSTGVPVINSEFCQLLGVRYEDQSFDFTLDGTCRKIIRTWYVLDWCNYELTGDTKEYEFQQTIKINNLDKPYFVQMAKDTTFCSFSGSCDSLLISDYLLATAFDSCTSVDQLQTSYAVYSLSDTTLVGQGEGLDANGKYAIGKYYVEFEVSDKCGNSAWYSFNFEVNNCKAPTPYCLTGLSTALVGMDTDADGELDAEMSMLTPDYFDNGSYHACGYDVQLSFSEAVDDTLIIFNCQDIGVHDVMIWVTDKNGNQDFCLATILVEDNNEIDFCKGDSTRFSIKGRVYTEFDMPVVDTKIDLLTFESKLTIADALGDYIFANLPMMVGYNVVPSNNDMPLNGVSTLDLILIQRHILGIDFLDGPYQHIAADINNDERITASDLVQLRKLILGIDANFTNNTSWRFVDESFVFDDNTYPWTSSIPENYLIDTLTQEMDIDFIGVKIGDVNGSAEFGNLQHQKSTKRFDEPLELVIENRVVSPEEIIEVKFLLGEQIELSGLQLNFELQDVQVVDITMSGVELAPENTSLNNTNAKLSIDFSDALDVKVNTDFIILKLRPNIYSYVSDLIGLSERGMKSEVYTGSELSTRDLTLTWIDEDHEYAQNQLILHQNTPNPWDNSTTVKFEIPEPGKVEFKIYNVENKLVFKEIKYYEAGLNRIMIDKSMLSIAGIYMYETIYNSQIERKKMIFVE